MSDRQKPLNLDLETAENLLRAAGEPALAEALNYHAHGVRNLVQGEWGTSFVNSLEGLLTKHIAPLSEQIGGLRGDTTALQAEFRDGLSRVEGTVSTLAESVNELQALYVELDKRDAKQYAETQRLFREGKARQKQLGRELAVLSKSFEEYKAGSRRNEVDQLLAFKVDVEQRIARALPEDETYQLIALLRQIAAERGGDG